MPYEAELRAALDAAAQASTVIMDQYARFEAIADAPASITTAADRESQEVILRHLTKAFPNDAFRAEESTPTLVGLEHSGARIWIIDPIDGTRGFARKNGEFSVMVGFVHNGEPVVGVVLEPASQRCTYATRGAGCWRMDGSDKPVPVRVTTMSVLAESVLVQSRTDPAKGKSRPERWLKPKHVVETYSAGIKMARVARGDADVYVSTYFVMKDWDLAAGHALVEEAGGKLSNLQGKALRYGDGGPGHQGGLIASNGALHELALSAMSQ
jgi:3'(2'), 5'-bisphosphate nucleotidase